MFGDRGMNLLSNFGQMLQVEGFDQFESKLFNFSLKLEFVNSLRTLGDMLHISLSFFRLLYCVVRQTLAWKLSKALGVLGPPVNKAAVFGDTIFGPQVPTWWRPWPFLACHCVVVALKESLAAYGWKKVRSWVWRAWMGGRELLSFLWFEGRFKEGKENRRMHPSLWSHLFTSPQKWAVEGRKRLPLRKLQKFPSNGETSC